MALVFHQVFSDQRAVGFDLLLIGGSFVIVNGGFLAAAWLLGDAARTREDNERELARRAEELATQQEERARRAVHARSHPRSRCPRTASSRRP